MRYLTIYCLSLWQNYYIPYFMKLAINITLKMTLNYTESYPEEDANKLFSIITKVYKKRKDVRL